MNFKEGLANFSYSFKPQNRQDSKKSKSKAKKDKANFEVIDKKERKRDITETWDLSSGEEDIDKFDINDFDKKNSSMPMAEPTQRNVKKRKVEVKHKIKDYQDKKEKKDFFLQKRLHIEEEAKKAYAELLTPNKVCEFVISSFGLKPETIGILEKYESNFKKVENYGYNGVIEKDTLEGFAKFKEEFLGSFESKRQRNLLEDSLFWINGSCRNLLVIRNVLPENTYFGKLGLMSPSPDEKGRKKNGDGNSLEEYLTQNLKEEITPREFINAIKSGFNLAICK